MPASDYTSVVQNLYLSYFGRPADSLGLANFSAALNAMNAPTTVEGLNAAYSTNATVKALIDSFGSSAESTALYGTGDTLSFVSAIYENLLGRSPDLSGLLFWSNALNSGSLTKGQAALAISAGALSNTAPGSADSATIANKITVATTFTNLVDTTNELSGYIGSTAANQARALLSTVTASNVPPESQIEHTLSQIVNLPGLNVPKPVDITNIVNNYNTTNQVHLDTAVTKATAQSGAVPGYYLDVLSYVISNTGEITFNGPFANSLTAEDKAGDILAILQNKPGTVCSFTQFDEQTQKTNTYLVCTGTGSSNPAVIEIVGVVKNGVDNITIQSGEFWSS